MAGVHFDGSPNGVCVVTAALTYFDMRGRAEASRLLMMDLDIAFEDRRVTSSEDWERLKPQLPMGTLPVYSHGDLSVSESHAILRHLARENGLEPTPSKLVSKLDEAHEAVASLQEELWFSFWIDPSPYDGGAFEHAVLPHRLAGLERLRAKHSGQFWLSDEPTRVDYLAFTVLDEIHAFFPNALELTPALRGTYQMMNRRPSMVGYFEKQRPAVFGMGRDGPKIDRRRRYDSGSTFECPWAEPVVLEDEGDG